MIHIINGNNLWSVNIYDIKFNCWSGTAASWNDGRSSLCIFMKKQMNLLLQKALSGFAAGVMVAASIWSLLIPAMEQSEAMGKLAFLPATIGFWLGIIFLLLIDTLMPHLHIDSKEAEGVKSNFKRTTMMVFAIIIHNIPEGWQSVLSMPDGSVATRTLR